MVLLHLAQLLLVLGNHHLAFQVELLLNGLPFVVALLLQKGYLALVFLGHLGDLLVEGGDLELVLFDLGLQLLQFELVVGLELVLLRVSLRELGLEVLGLVRHEVSCELERSTWLVVQCERYLQVDVLVYQLLDKQVSRPYLDRCRLLLWLNREQICVHRSLPRRQPSLCFTHDLEADLLLKI